MSKTTAQPVARLYAHLDSISEARRHSDLQRRTQELNAAQASVNAFPINPGGWQSPGRVTMQAQVAEVMAQKAEQIRWIESLSGDELCVHYCGNEIAQSEAPPVRELRNPDGSPLARGEVPSMIPPGMPR